MTPLDVAILFHETYERLAPSFGYETRADTKQFDPESKNGRLMVAVCAEVRRRLKPEISSAKTVDLRAEIRELREIGRARSDMALLEVAQRIEDIVHPENSPPFETPAELKIGDAVTLIPGLPFNIPTDGWTIKEVPKMSTMYVVHHPNGGQFCIERAGFTAKTAPESPP